MNQPNPKDTEHDTRNRGRRPRKRYGKPGRLTAWTSRPSRSGGGRARSERGRQDDVRAHRRDAAASTRDGAGSGHDVRREPARCGADRAGRSVRRGGAGDDRPREPRDDGAALRWAAAASRSAGEVLAQLRSRRDGRPPRAHLFGRRAPQARSRRKPRGLAATAAARRADHGLDPRAASGCGMRSAARRQRGTGVLLTTQYLDEADQSRRPAS